MIEVLEGSARKAGKEYRDTFNPKERARMKTSLLFLDNNVNISAITSLFGKKTIFYSDFFPVIENRLVIFSKIVRVTLYLNNIKK